VNELRLARRYAEALFAEAKEQGAIEEALQDLELAGRALAAAPQALPVLDHPEIPPRDKRRLVADILRDVRWEPSRDFVALLIVRGRRELLTAITGDFRSLVERDAGILSVEVTAAVAPTQDQVARLVRALARRTGNTIKLDVAVDPEVLAGMVIRMGDRTIDGTARGRLQEMRSHLVELEMRRSE
jgi:F-type H+-transporting ATPase subunit delta